MDEPHLRFGVISDIHAQLADDGLSLVPDANTGTIERALAFFRDNGADALFENEPEIRIASLALANAQGTGNGEQGTAVAMTVTVEVKDGEDVVKVAEEKVAAMFEATSDLRDWTGAAKLTPTVSGATRNADNTMTFTVTPGDGTAKSAFLRVKVK